MLIGNVSSGMSQYQGSELLVREIRVLARVHVAGSEGCGFGDEYSWNLTTYAALQCRRVLSK